jgi:hypothetical protein
MHKPELYFPIIDNGMGLSRSTWALSLFAAALTVLRDYKVNFETISYPYPDGAMNIATQHFLESTAERMIVIDTDVIFHVNDLRVLLQHDCELVFGIYPKKQPGLVFPIQGLPGDTNPFSMDDDRPLLREMARCARGFMNVHRKAFERLMPTTDYTELHGKGRQWLFWKMLPGQHSEDFRFCDDYRRMGGKVMVDIGISCQHEGSARYPIHGTYNEQAPALVVC